MCGIAGFLDSHGCTAVSLHPMMDALARRGPDGEGVATWPGVTFGHCRLAILDLSEAGRQPMISDDGQTGLVFNGCIYNYLELRQELAKLGHRFRSRCDTEVLLRGYQEWGIDKLVARLRGMFAFGIWDGHERKLMLARDRLGVKPLVYAARNGRIAFASTIDALQKMKLGGEIDAEAALEFFEFGFVTDQRVIFKEINKLPPGAILEWKNGQMGTRTYWSLPAIDPCSARSFPEAVEETEQLILDSVRLRLCSDVPMGVLLSGGVDSALVCWALTKLNANVKAFTVGVPQDPSDESGEARETARVLGIAHEVVRLDDEENAPIEEMVDAFSEPFASQSALGMLRVSRAVKPLATVLLTGDGGDDVFLGYGEMYTSWRAQRLAQWLPPYAPPLWRALRPLVTGGGWLRRGRNFLGYATGGLGAYARTREGVRYFEKESLFGDRLAGTRLVHRHIPTSFDSARHLLQDVLFYHQKLHFTSEFLPKVDGATMHYSIEARSPLLDQKIWEMAAMLPAGVRLHGGQRKAVLREIARRRIGPGTAFRRKRGFTIPVERWLARQWKSSFEELQSGTLLEKENWMRRGSLGPAVRAALACGRVPVQLWYLLVFERWLQRKGAGAGRPAV